MPAAFGGFGQLLLQLFSRFAAFGEAVGKNDSGLDAFFPRIFDNRRNCLVIDGDHRQRNFPGHIENARIGFQSKDFRASRIDWDDAGWIEPHVLQILENIHGVVIAVAGADNGETVGLEERR